jgi:hypothetical protein
MLVLRDITVLQQVFIQFNVVTGYTQMLELLNALIALLDIIVQSQLQQKAKC